jgi:hypothetical protein
MKTEPLQSLGPERVVALQHVVMQAPQPPDGDVAPAVPAAIPGEDASFGGACLTGVGPLTSVVSDGDGCVWSWGLPADAAGTAIAAASAAPSAATAVLRFTNTYASLPLPPPPTAAVTVALPDQRTQDVRAGRV